MKKKFNLYKKTHYSLIKLSEYSNFVLASKVASFSSPNNSVLISTTLVNSSTAYYNYYIHLKLI